MGRLSNFDRLTDMIHAQSLLGEDVLLDLSDVYTLLEGVEWLRDRCEWLTQRLAESRTVNGDRKAQLAVHVQKTKAPRHLARKAQMLQAARTARLARREADKRVAELIMLDVAQAFGLKLEEMRSSTRRHRHYVNARHEAVRLISERCLALNPNDIGLLVGLDRTTVIFILGGRKGRIPPHLREEMKNAA